MRSNFTQPGASPTKKKTGLMMLEGKEQRKKFAVLSLFKSLSN